MKKSLFPGLFLIIPVIALSSLSCSKGTTKNNEIKNDTEISLDSVDIERKYLDEGFITSDLYRVVIISPKEAGMADDIETVTKKAKKKARLAIEYDLSGSNIQCDRNTRAEIINLINQNGQLSKKDIEHRRYNVFYYDIIRKNMKNYLKSIASQR